MQKELRARRTALKPLVPSIDVKTCPLFDIRRTVPQCSNFLVKPFPFFLRSLLRLERRAFVNYPMVPLNIRSGQLVVGSVQLIPRGPATKTDITDRESPAKSEFGFRSYCRLYDCNNLLAGVVVNSGKEKARSSSVPFRL
jgi:hypothetical protein